MKKIYCINEGTEPGWMRVTALCEDGTFLRKSDLVLAGHAHTHNHPYDEHCGVGHWELEWIEKEALATHLGYQAALKVI